MAVSMFGYNNAVKTGSLVSNASSPLGLDVSQLQNDAGAPSMAWQTNSVNANLTITTASTAATWGAVCCARSNLSATATLRVQVYTDATKSTTVYNSGVVTPAMYAGLLVFLFTQCTGGCAVLTFSDASNPEGCLNIPLIFAGPVFQPKRGISWSTTRGRDIRVDEIVSRSGVEFPQFRWSRRRVSIDAQSIDPTEYATFDAIDAEARTGQNILFIPDPAASTITRDTLFGRCTPKADFGYMTGGARLTWKADLTERL